jgi:uncharacterized glyoxalase superfamily protein PhnB
MSQNKINDDPNNKIVHKKLTTMGSRVYLEDNFPNKKTNYYEGFGFRDYLECLEVSSYNVHLHCRTLFNDTK